MNDYFGDFLTEIYLNNSVTSWLKFAGWLLFAFIGGRILSRLLSHLLYRIFRRLSQENRVREFDKLVRPSLTYLIGISIFYLSIGTLNPPDFLLNEIYNITWVQVLLKVYQVGFAVVGIVFLLKISTFISSTLADKAAQTEKLSDDQIVLFVKDLAKVLIIILGAFFILGSILKVNVTSLLAGAGIAGLAIALAAKETLEDLLGSFTIFIEKPFTIGDFIQVGEVLGTVEKVGFRSTLVRTLDKTLITMPNRIVVASHSENLTSRTFRRVKMTVGLVYGTPKDVMDNIIKDIQQFIDSHELTNQDGIIGFFEFGENSLDILVNYFVNNLDWNTYVKVREEINFEIMRIVAKHGSDFAFPTRTVHISKEN